MSGKLELAVRLFGRTEYSQHPDIDAALARLGKVAAVNRLRLDHGNLVDAEHGVQVGSYTMREVNP